MTKSGETTGIRRRMFGGMTNPLSIPGLEDTDNLPPEPNEVMLVQCERFRCLAFRDRQGKWRSPFSKMELPRVVHVIEPSPY